MTSASTNIAFDIDPTTHAAIDYPMGIVKDTSHMAEAQLFYDYLLGEEASDAFEQFGFTVKNTAAGS